MADSVVLENVKAIRRFLRTGGLIQVGASTHGNSWYFGRPGIRWVLRLADHKAFKHDDVICSFVPRSTPMDDEAAASAAAHLIETWRVRSDERERASTPEERKLVLGKRYWASDLRLRAAKQQESSQ